MNFNFTNYNYDNCSFEGKCVQEPYFNSINEYITKEISDLIYYVEELRKKNYINEKFDIELISFFEKVNVNFNFNSENLLQKIRHIVAEKRNVKNLYSSICKENKKVLKKLSTTKQTKKKLTISDVAKIGEKIFLKRQKTLTPLGNAFYSLYLVLLRNLVRNLSDIYDYDEDLLELNKKILKAISKLKNFSYLEKNMEESINELILLNYEIFTKRQEIYVNEYGEIKETEVDFSSRANKCILVSGRKLKILDDLLKAVDGLDIDIYTHDRMIFAHQYDYFKRNANLRGQFQKGQMSFKYDFASFPGPIILDNLEINACNGIYQGNLFTINQLVPYGVSAITDKDFSSVLSVADKMKGFKRNHYKNKIKIGYNNEEIQKFIDKLIGDIKLGKYTSLLIIGLFHQDAVNEDFFLELVSKLDKKTFILSLACDVKTENSIHFSNYYDYSLVIKVLKGLSSISQSFSINAYIVDCSEFIMQNLLLLNYFNVNNIFIQECPELPNNRYLRQLLNERFNTYITSFDINEDLSIINYN